MTAKRIVAHFGVKTLDIIETSSDRLIEVPGIAKKRVDPRDAQRERASRLRGVKRLQKLSCSQSLLVNNQVGRAPPHRKSDSTKERREPLCLSVVSSSWRIP